MRSLWELQGKSKYIVPNYGNTQSKSCFLNTTVQGSTGSRQYSRRKFGCDLPTLCSDCIQHSFLKESGHQSQSQSATFKIKRERERKRAEAPYPQACTARKQGSYLKTLLSMPNKELKQVMMRERTVKIRSQRNILGSLGSLLIKNRIVRSPGEMEAVLLLPRGVPHAAISRCTEPVGWSSLRICLQECSHPLS